MIALKSEGPLSPRQMTLRVPISLYSTSQRIQSSFRSCSLFKTQYPTHAYTRVPLSPLFPRPIPLETPQLGPGCLARSTIPETLDPLGTSYSQRAHVPLHSVPQPPTTAPSPVFLPRVRPPPFGTAQPHQPFTQQPQPHLARAPKVVASLQLSGSVPRTLGGGGRSEKRKGDPRSPSPLLERPPPSPSPSPPRSSPSSPSAGRRPAPTTAFRASRRPGGGLGIVASAGAEVPADRHRPSPGHALLAPPPEPPRTRARQPSSA
jgi:hypothetical protein